MSRDLYSGTEAVQTLAPAARTASANGTGVDLAGYNAALVLVNVGAWTDGTHTFEVQDSDDNSTFAAVADDYLIGTEPVVDAADEDNVVYEVGYKGIRRYLRVIVTCAGTTTGAIYGAVIVRGKPSKASTR